MSAHHGNHPRAQGRGLFLAVAWIVAAASGCGGDAESRDLPDPASQPGTVEEAWGGDVGAAPSAPEPDRSLPAGTRLTFEMLESVSTGSHAAGDTFELRLVEEVRGSGGLILPAGTRARGVVMESQPSRAGTEAVLGVRIQSVDLHGRMRDLPGTVESVSVRSATGESDARTAAKVATGAAAGAVLGQVLGRDTRSAVTGAAAGAAAGVGVALTTRAGHATLEEGARVTLRLDRKLLVP